MTFAVDAPNPKRSSRDPAALREKLSAWLGKRLPAGAAPEITSVSSPSATGMSSETLLFEATWSEGGARRDASLVARVAPDPSDAPVFPRYDLETQYRLIDLVGARSRVPVPRLRWLELDESHLGAPFFVMDRVDGRVPPDVLPYNFGSWLTEAAAGEQRRLQDGVVDVLVQLHSIDLRGVDLSFLAGDAPGGDTPLRRHIEGQRRYYDWMRGTRRYPLIERAFAWLEQSWPAEESPAVISWGDSRIGNILFREFDPVAVLDWEMAALAPPEVDLGWLVFMHVFFDDFARQAGLPGMPDFLRPEDVARTYEERSGRRVRDFPFYQVYAALRHAIIMARIFARQVHFGEAQWPEDVEESILHRETLQKMIEGRWF